MDEEDILDVVIVGNGPAALVLSFLLSGHRPQVGDCDLLSLSVEQLKERCSLCKEGRSKNPVALMWDQLLFPGADDGALSPSELQWMYYPQQSVKHMAVGGAAQAGGSWGAMTGTWEILSPSRWMALPGAPFGNDEFCSRALVSEYYASYPSRVGIGERFLNGITVTDARLEEGDIWSVRLSDGRLIRARYLCVAAGMYDVPRRLGVPGEDDAIQSDYITYRTPKSWPEKGGSIVVIGAGLSAADCIIEAFRRGIQVKHIFRRKVSGTSEGSLDRFNGSWDGYAHYAFLFELMKRACGTATTHIIPPWGLAGLPFNVTTVRYQAFPARTVHHFGPDLMIHLDDGSSVAVPHAAGARVVVLVGSEPSFEWLHGLNRSALAHVDSKKNPIPVDPYTFYYDHGVYFLGPAAGDNFVRFITGHAYGVARDVLALLTKKLRVE